MHKLVDKNKVSINTSILKLKRKLARHEITGEIDQTKA